MSKIVEVGCAVIESQRRILISQRKPGTYYAGWWEFPGGKRELSETLFECLKREVTEELGIRIEPYFLLGEKRHAYTKRDVRLVFCLCRIVSGTPVRLDCHDFRWVRVQDLRRYQFLPPDWDMIHDLTAKSVYYFSQRVLKVP
jgi:8-oxo-dGTP diphosphatase